MKELVRHGAEHAARVPLDRGAFGDDRTVAMFHAVAAAPRDVVAEERIRPAVEFRELAEHRALLAHDLLRAGGVLVDVRLGRVVMDRRADGELPAVGIADGERPERLVAELGRAVHQVLEVRRREGPRIVGREQLRRGLPVGALGRHELHADGAPLEAARPHQGRRHVHVRVRGVDAEIGAVDVVAEHLVGDAHARRMLRHVPLVRVRPDDPELAAALVEGVHVEDVLGELVQRVAARRRSAHAQLQRRRGQIGQGQFDLGIVVLRRGKRDAIHDGRLCGRRRRRQRGEGQHEGKRKGTAHERRLRGKRNCLARVDSL